MSNRVPPAAVAGIVAIAVIVIGYFAYKVMMAPPPTAAGIGANGQAMSRADVQNLATKMSGGKAKFKPPAQ